MKKAASLKPPPELEELITLIRQGRLFDVESRVQSGRTLHWPEFHVKHCPLSKAVETGFHSMVEVLLRFKKWPLERLNAALNCAIAAKRLDLAELLQTSGAAPSAVDFELVCRTMDGRVIEKFLRAGADPSKENAFARALSDMKARPLLGLYRSLRHEFPSLHSQASLALAEAINEKSVRWIALLAWAGADPFMKVPNDLYATWEFGEFDGRIAAHEACWRRDDEIIKVLHLKPTAEQGAADDLFAYGRIAVSHGHAPTSDPEAELRAADPRRADGDTE